MLTDQDKKEILLGNGLNPEEFDLSEDGYRATKKVVAQPSITNTPVAPSTTKFDLSPTGDTPFTTGAKTFAEGAPVALATGGGMGLGLIAGTALAPATGGASYLIPILMALAGGGAAGYGAKKLQDVVEPEEWKANVEASRNLNPTAGTIGDLSTLPLSGFRPSFRNLKIAGQAMPKLLTGQSLTGLEKAAGMNVGLGTSLGALQPTVESLATTGELPAASDVLTSAAIGSILTEPWALGRKFGFKNTSVPEQLPGLEDVANAPLPVTLNPRPENVATIKPEDVSLLNRLTGAQYKELPAKGPKLTLAERIYNETHGIPTDATKTELVPAGTGTLSEVGAAETSARVMQEAFDKGLPVTENPTTRAYEIRAAEAEKSRQDWEEARIQNEALKRAQTDSETARLKAENERMANELRAGLQPKLEAAPLPPPKATTKLGKEIRPDYTGVTEDANTQVKNESPADLEARRAEGFKDKYSPESELDNPTPGTAQSISRHGREKDFELSLDAVSKGSKRVTSLSYEAKNILTKALQNDNNLAVHEIIDVYGKGKSHYLVAKRENFSDVINERAKLKNSGTVEQWGKFFGFKDKEISDFTSGKTPTFSNDGTPSYRYSEDTPIGTEFTGKVVSKIKDAGISPERTPSWKTKWGQFLRYKRGIKVVNGEVMNEVTGQRVAGRTIKNKVGEIVNEIDNVKGKLDTDAHEGIHGFIDSIRDTPLYRRFEQLVSSSPEFQAINEARSKSGAERWTPEEYIATEQGYEFLDRNLKLKGETEFNTWWKDFSSHVKTKFGKGGNASPEDYRRILQYKFQYDKPTKGSPGSVLIVNNQSTSQLEKPTDKDWQVTVQPEEPGIPGTGYVQIDDITGGVNHWSKGPESLGKEGYNIPDFKKLPMGKYKYEDAVKKLGKYSEKSELADPAVDKVTKLGEKAFDDSIEAASYENELAAKNAGELSDKFYNLRGVLSGSKLDVRNSEKSQLDSPYFTGTVDSNGAVKAHSHDENLAGKSHGQFGDLNPTGRWRYIPKHNRVDWTDTPPTVDAMDAVDNYLSKHKITPTKHTSYIGNADFRVDGENVNPLGGSRYSEKSELDTHYKASFVPFLTARFDKIAENLKSPTAKMVTDNLNNFAAEQDMLTGRIGNELIIAGKDFNTEEQQRVYRYAHQMSVNGDSNINLTGREKKLFNARLAIIQDVRKLQNELGLKVRAGEEFRAGGIDPKGYIFSEIDPAVANTWAEKPNSSQSKEYDAAYIKHMTDHGISLKDATQALHEYKGAIGSNKPIDVEFGALRKAAGVGLPWELIDKNFNSAAIRYARRASRDLAYFKWIQNNPKMLKALDLRDQYGKLPSAEDVKDIENIAPNAAVKQAMRSVEGVSDNNINPTIMAYARVANNTIMGIGTAARNILNMPAFIATYVQTSQLPKVAQAISHMSESRVRAFKNNAVRASFEDFDAAGYYLGNPNPTIRLLNRYSELSRKYQGRNLSDKFEGEYYYSLGELLATDNIAKAIEGNKESKSWVKKFGSTVDKGADSLLSRKVTPDDVERMAKAFVDAARGTYGPSGLPSFAIEGQLSPFFALSRFSIEKANTVWKDVVEPARKGIYGPAIRYILGSAGVGYAIEALNELLSNKRGGEPTMKEVVESGTREDMIAKAISTAQLASFAGIVSDGAQLVSNAARGKGLSYSNPVSFPLYTLVTDTFGRNITDATNAIKEGEDVFEVLGKLATVLSTQSVQTMRYLDAHVLHPEEAKKKEKFRDYNVWMQLTDRAQPEQSGKANEFKNLSSKEFKRESDLPKAVAMIPDLVSKAVRKSKDRNGNIDPVMLSENLKSLKLNSYQIMPALENDPKAFADYYQHVSETQGADKAKKLLIDFMSQREVNKVKNSLIPSY